MKKNKKFLLIFFIIFLFGALLFVFVMNAYSFNRENTLEVSKTYYKNSNPIDLANVIEQNTSVKKTEKLVIEEMDLEYKTIYKENKKMPSGCFRITQLGENGKQNVILKQKYENEVFLGEQLVSNNIVKNSTEKIIEIGTGNGYINPEIKEKNKVYVSIDKLKLKASSDMSSDNIGILEYNQELKISKIYDNCYEVEVDGKTGYVLKDGVSKYNPNKDYNISSNDVEEYSKEDLIANLSFDMDVSTQSNLSLEQFEAIFENNPYDKYDVFKNNAKYFYYAEEQYNINGVFLAAIGVHESAWGSSAIARNKNNLFGFCAYDNDPYNSASNFTNASEGIDLVARVLMKNYLNPPGTVLYDGSSASGRYYSGKTIKSVNVHYATDKNWANCVYSWMEKLYNSIP